MNPKFPLIHFIRTFIQIISFQKYRKFELRNLKHKKTYFCHTTSPNILFENNFQLLPVY